MKHGQDSPVDPSIESHVSGFIDSFLTPDAAERARYKPSVLGDWVHHVLLSKCRASRFIPIEIGKLTDEGVLSLLKKAGVRDDVAVMEMNGSWSMMSLARATERCWEERLISAIPGEIAFLVNEDVEGGLFVLNEARRRRLAAEVVWMMASR